jgi:hypothetical protein
MKTLTDGDIDCIMKKARFSTASAFKVSKKRKWLKKKPKTAITMPRVPFTTEKDRNIKAETNRIKRAQLNYEMSKMTPNEIAEMWRKKDA